MQVSRKQFESIVGVVRRGSSRDAISLPEQRALICRSAKLARQGKYQEAEQLLALLAIDGPLAETVLDLRAKVYAQQGRFVEAEHCWLEALRRSPGNATYRRAIECLAGSRQFPRGAHLVLGAIALLVLLLVMRWIGDLRGSQDKVLERVEQLGRQVEALRAGTTSQRDQRPQNVGDQVASPTNEAAHAQQQARGSVETQPSHKE